MLKLLCSLAAGAAFLGVTAATANASTCAGTCTPLTPSSSTSPAGFINSNFGDGGIGPGAAITDIFPFTVVPPPSNWASASDEITLNAGNISGLLLSLYSGTFGGAHSLVASAGQYLGPPTQVDFLPLPPGTIPLTGGTYFLEVSGTAIGTVSYSGTLDVYPAATPLPGALALFAGGLGLLGFTGLRKRRKERGAVASVAAAA